MKPETTYLYFKYRYFLLILSDERNELFYKSKTELDYEKFFNLYDHILDLHYEIKPLWRNYNKQRSQMIKRFEYGKYEMLLRLWQSHKYLRHGRKRLYFCTDIKNVILGYLFV